ncbi:unnamed protein product [Blepharisma stoltei]|uniref:Alpha N-terminal protein methyltransferase 1 n=1 Tax=Blepharisma stoltei TaxID=1481888 RepID=A0AAU9J1P3_9CILI|nr:unnamed protein product [Blepharisma stoltei]
MDTKELFPHEKSGTDTFGEAYASPEEMWRRELHSKFIRDKETWYHLGNSYWSSQESSLNGVLGGYEIINQPDINTSREFVAFLKTSHAMAGRRALDCGCGIGRVTKFLLLNEFETVDLVDQCQKYVDHARTFVDDSRAVNFYVQGLQNFNPEPRAYDCIWIQWVLAQLTDEDLVSFLRRIQNGLREGGIICIKENIKKNGFMVHKEDFSVTRSDKIYKIAFRNAGLRIIHEQLQPNFPEDLYKVKMYACVPI